MLEAVDGMGSAFVGMAIGITRCFFESRGLSTMDAASWVLFLVGDDGPVAGEVGAGRDVLPVILVVVED